MNLCLLVNMACNDQQTTVFVVGALSMMFIYGLFLCEDDDD